MREGGLVRALVQKFSEACVGVAGVGLVIGMMLLMVGGLYWLWMAIQFGSFGMFVLGLIPPFYIFTGPIGAWSLIFGPPSWVVDWFG